MKKGVISELSDFSIIDADNESNFFQNEGMRDLIKNDLNSIKTKRDIYAEDILMTKIIHYVG